MISEIVLAQNSIYEDVERRLDRAMMQLPVPM